MAIDHFDSMQKYVRNVTAHASMTAVYELVNAVQAQAHPNVRGGVGFVGMNSGAYFQKAVAARATRHGGFRFTLVADPGTLLTLFQVFEGGTVHLTIVRTAAGAIEVWRGNYGSTLVGASAAGALPAVAGSYVSWKFGIHDTTGSALMRVNGVDVINVSGVDTRNGGTSGLIDMLRFFCVSGYGFYSDLYIGDTTGPAPQNDIINEVTINAHASANVNLDELAPDDDATVDTLAAPGDVTATAAFADLPSGVAQVLSVQRVVRARKDDAGAGSITPRLISGGADHDGAAVALGVSYSTTVQRYDASPFTSSAWTVGEVNGLSGRVRRTA